MKNEQNKTYSLTRLLTFFLGCKLRSDFGDTMVSSIWSRTSCRLGITKRRCLFSLILPDLLNSSYMWNIIFQIRWCLYFIYSMMKRKGEIWPLVWMRILPYRNHESTRVRDSISECETPLNTCSLGMSIVNRFCTFLFYNGERNDW